MVCAASGLRSCGRQKSPRYSSRQSGRLNVTSGNHVKKCRDSYKHDFGATLTMPLQHSQFGGAHSSPFSQHAGLHRLGHPPLGLFSKIGSRNCHFDAIERCRGYTELTGGRRSFQGFNSQTAGQPTGRRESNARPE